MTRGPVVLAAVAGAACGLAGGVLGASLVLRDPGRGRGEDGSLRGDLDRIEAETLAARAAQADAAARALERIAALEARPAAAQPGDAGAAHALASDLRALRDAAVRDFRAADARLAELERRVDELAALAALAPLPAARAGPATEQDEAGWVNLARDADPLRRFSALAMLGRARTDRSVRASVEALRDPAEIVVWQALRNLASFEERGAVAEIAALLRHDAVSLRNAAHEALRRMGAPDAGFDPTALPEERRAATEALDRWVGEQRAE